MREVEWEARRGFRGGELGAGEGLPVSPRVSNAEVTARFCFFFFFLHTQDALVHNFLARLVPMIDNINVALAASEGRAGPSCGLAKEQILQEFSSVSKLHYNRVCKKCNPAVI